MEFTQKVAFVKLFIPYSLIKLLLIKLEFNGFPKEIKKQRCDYAQILIFICCRRKGCKILI